MYKVLYNKPISSASFEIAIEAPLAIRNAMPGQFCIVMPHEDSERIPLTIYDILVMRMKFVPILRNLKIREYVMWLEE